MGDSFYESLRTSLQPERAKDREGLEILLRKFADSVLRQPTHEKSYFEILDPGGAIEIRGYLPYGTTCETLARILEKVPLRSIQTNVSPIDQGLGGFGSIRCRDRIRGLSEPFHKSECAHIWEPGDPIRVLRADRGFFLCRAGDGYLAWVKPEELEETLETRNKWEPPISISLFASQDLSNLMEHWKGVPYLWGGTGREGVDCSGFVMRLYQTVGLQIPRDSHQQMLMGSLVETEDGVHSHKVGDLLFFTHDDGRIGHVGFSLGGAKVLHAQEGGVGVFSLDPEDRDYNPYRTRHFVFAKRLMGPY